MAKDSGSKKKASKPKKKAASPKKRRSAATDDELGEALKALEGHRHVQYFGGLNDDGTINLDDAELKKLKAKLKKKGISTGKVRFVALNAPFKRRSQDIPA